MTVQGQGKEVPAEAIWVPQIGSGQHLSFNVCPHWDGLGIRSQAWPPCFCGTCDRVRAVVFPLS
jgi:hypothetical protein